MRNIINNYEIVADQDPRTILINENFTFTKQQIRKVYNVTQDIIYITPDAEDRNFTLNGKSIIINNSFPVIGLNDVIDIEIDYIPASDFQIPTFTAPISFTTNTVKFRIPETGIMTSLGEATNLKIKKIDLNNWIDINLPYNVTIGDYIIAECLPGCVEQLVIQRTSLSGAEINPGTLGSKIVNGCNNFAYYSSALNKVLIGGLAVFDEDRKIIVGDGLLHTNFVSSSPINRTYVEHNGYLYTYSYERGGLVRINLTNYETNLLYTTTVVYMFNNMRVIGEYLYFFGWTSNGYVNISTLSSGALYTDGNAVSFVIDDGTSVYASHANAGKIYKVTGTTVLGTTGTIYTKATAISGNYLYSCSDNYVYKIDKTTMSVVATITTNRSATSVWALIDNDILYTIYSDGYMTKIDLSTFVSPTSTINLGFAINNPIVRIYNGKIYVLPRGATNFKTYNIATAEVLTYNLINDANSFSIDNVNDRLVFYSHQLSATITLKPVEIINIP